VAEQLGPPLEQATDAHQPGFDQGSQPLGRQDERVISPGFRRLVGRQALWVTRVASSTPSGGPRTTSPPCS
jgi:hypothetical protein